MVAWGASLLSACLGSSVCLSPFLPVLLSLLPLTNISWRPSLCQVCAQPQPWRCSLPSWRQQHLRVS